MSGKGKKSSKGWWEKLTDCGIKAAQQGREGERQAVRCSHTKGREANSKLRKGTVKNNYGKRVK